MNPLNGKKDKASQDLGLESQALGWLFNIPLPPTEDKRIVYIGHHDGFTLMVIQKEAGLEIIILGPVA